MLDYRLGARQELCSQWNGFRQTTLIDIMARPLLSLVVAFSLPVYVESNQESSHNSQRLPAIVSKSRIDDRSSQFNCSLGCL